MARIADEGDNNQNAKTKLENNFIACENYTQFKISVSKKIKIYWNTSTPICLCIVYGCFGTIAAELLQRWLKRPPKPEIFTSCPFTENIPIQGSKSCQCLREESSGKEKGKSKSEGRGWLVFKGLRRRQRGWTAANGERTGRKRGKCERKGQYGADLRGTGILSETESLLRGFKREPRDLTAAAKQTEGQELSAYVLRVGKIRLYCPYVSAAIWNILKLWIQPTKHSDLVSNRNHKYFHMISQSSQLSWNSFYYLYSEIITILSTIFYSVH